MRDGLLQPIAGGLQASPHARNRAVVVAALNIDRLSKAAFKFRQVIRDIRHKIGERAVRLFHHAVFVVTVVGGL